MRARAARWLVPWLLAAAAAQVAAFEAVRRGFVGTARGQLVDTAALDANTIGERHIEGLVDAVLGTVTVLSVVAAMVAIGFFAVLRGRVALAGAATLLVVGANLTSQLLKHLLVRPDYGVDLERAVAGNSLPSGHTTVAASMAAALVLVLPPQLRGLAALLGAGYAAAVGVATISADWHRPSDSVTALLIVGAWAAVAGLVLASGRTVAGRAAAGGGRPGGPRPWPGAGLATLTLAGCLLLALAIAAMVLTDRALAAGELSTRVDLLSRGRLLTAYAGGAAGVAGVASLVMALVLLIAQLAVPARRQPPHPRPPSRPDRPPQVRVDGGAYLGR
jgi:membrane-associated phospholipid phosphatase